MNASVAMFHDVATTLTLDALLDLDHAALTALYEGGALPRLDALRGDLRGRMLAVPALPAVVTALPCAWARTASFPWRGKSFMPETTAEGEGVNRVILDRWRLFTFRTRVAPSRHDGREVIELDYDRPANPFFIRAIEDEIREVAPGLYLGQAWLRVGAKKTFVLWFGLADAR